MDQPKKANQYKSIIKIKNNIKTFIKEDKMAKIVPMEGRILVERIKAEDKTKAGIYLPDSAKEKPKEAIVIEVGQGKLLDSGNRAKPLVKKGDKIIFTSYAGTEIKLDGVEYMIMNEDEVLAVIEG